MAGKANVKHPLNRSIIIAGASFILMLGIVISAATIFIFRTSFYTRYEKQMESILNYVEAHIDHDDMAECVETFVKSKKYEESTPEERMRFDNIRESFFEDVNRFITWEADKVTAQKHGTHDGIPVLKRTKAVRVHKENLRRELTERGVLVSQATLQSAQGNPVIMVIPDSPRDQTPLTVLDKNPLAKQAAATIESYLTARRYDVVVPRAQDQIEAPEGVLLRFRDGDLLSFEQDGLAGAAGAGQGAEALYGEVPLRQYLQHLLAHRAGGPQDAYVHFLHGRFLPFGLDLYIIAPAVQNHKTENENEA